MGAALINIVPIQELPPGGISAIRNEVINKTVDMVSKELNLAKEQLVARDIRPYGDLQLYSTGTTDSTSERWGYSATGTSIGYKSISGSKTMADQRWVAIYGVRDHGTNRGASGAATLAVALTVYKQCVSFIKISVGGGDKVIWDITSLRAYKDANVGISPSAIIIPQNTLFEISYYKEGNIEVGAVTAPVASEISWLQLMGICVEPRGKLVSP